MVHKHREILNNRNAIFSLCEASCEAPFKPDVTSFFVGWCIYENFRSLLPRPWLGLISTSTYPSLSSLSAFSPVAGWIRIVNIVLLWMFTETTPSPLKGRGLRNSTGRSLCCSGAASLLRFDSIFVISWAVFFLKTWHVNPYHSDLGICWDQCARTDIKVISLIIFIPTWRKQNTSKPHSTCSLHRVGDNWNLLRSKNKARTL